MIERIKLMNGKEVEIQICRRIFIVDSVAGSRIVSGTVSRCGLRLESGRWEINSYRLGGSNGSSGLVPMPSLPGSPLPAGASFRTIRESAIRLAEHIIDSEAL